MSERLARQIEVWSKRYESCKSDFERDGEITRDETVILESVDMKLATLRETFAATPPTTQTSSTPAAGPGDAPAPAPPQENPYRDRVLQSGSTGAAVQHLQTMLNDRGANLAADGVFGPATAQAAAAFQRSAALSADGVVGPNTWPALDAGAGSAKSGGSGSSGNRSTGGSTATVDQQTGESTPRDGAGSLDETVEPAESFETASPAQTQISGEGASAAATNASTPDVEHEIDTEYATITKDGIEFKVGHDLVKEGYNKVIARPYGIPVVLQFGAEIKVEFKVPVKKDKGMTGASLSLSVGARAALAAGLVNAGFEGRVPKEGLSAEAAKYLNLHIFGSFTMATTASTGVKLEKDQWVAELFRLEVVGGFAVGVKVADIVEQYKFGKFSLGSLSIGWSEDGKAFAKAESGGESAEMTAVLEDLIRKVKAKAGEKVEDLVDKHAPEQVKDAVDKATEWGADSEGSKQIADGTQNVLDTMDDLAKWTDDNLGTDFGEPGKDLGNAAEEAVRDFCDPAGETSQEATDRVNEENRRFDVSHTDFVDTMIALGLRAPGGKLVPYRDSDEYNAVHAAWQEESEVVAKGGEPSGKWKKMATQLRQTAIGRWKQKQKDAETLKEVERNLDDAEEAHAKGFVQAMEAMRLDAMGPGNVLNAKLQNNPNPQAQQCFQEGWTHWAAADAARSQTAGLTGYAKAQKAGEAIASYRKAKEAYQRGLQQV